MAERRMFTKRITDNDNFVGLSSSAQALYLHLCMAADDDGFCDQISIAMFKAHASTQDLHALNDRGYILSFPSGVICIKHWRMANTLRKDRYHPTAFREEKSQIVEKPNGSYHLATTWQPHGNQLATEVSIGKVNINSYQSRARAREDDDEIIIEEVDHEAE